MIDKAILRSTIFRHLDGLVIAPIAFSLKKKGVLDFILEKKKTNLAVISAGFNSNEGYLNVALRALASQGFLDYEVDNATDEISVSVNEKSAIAFPLFDLYAD